MSNDYYVVSGDSLRDVADTIRTKGGTSAQLEFPNGWKDAIDDIETGGDSGSIGNVWQDENGFVHLSAESGEESIPDDGKTRIFIHIAEGTPANRLTFYVRFKSSVASNTTVDWGDDTSETLGSTTATNYPHTYAQCGDYIITLTVNSGTISFIGTSSNPIYGSSSYGHNRSRITRIIFGDDVAEIGSYACYQCYALKSVKILSNITSIGTYAFAYCHSLTSVTIPDSVTSMSENVFNSCYSLTQLIIPDSVTSIGKNAFTYCYSLTSLTIPDSVTSISTSAFSSCNGMAEYHFKPTTPPTLGGSSAFSNIPSDCKIYVPYSADHSILDAYKTATNWSAHTNKIQEEPT